MQCHYPAINFQLYSLYPSGFLYGLFRNNPSYLLSFRAKFLVLKNKKEYQDHIAESTVYKGLNLCELTAYQFKIKPRASPQNSLMQAIAYIDLLEEAFLKKPDFLLLIGDLRLPFEIAKKLAQKHGIKTFFIEQGPFSTTVFDEKGVNANASIHGFLAKKGNPQSSQIIAEYLQKKTSKKYARSPFYRGLDYLIQFFLKKTALYPPDLKMPQPLTKNIETSQKNSGI